MKVHIVGGDLAIQRMYEARGYSFVDSPDKADIIQFTGGEDVDPSVYGHPKHPRTYSNPRRDLREQEVWQKAKRNQLKVGICRGAQFLCVMNGGKLWQDVSNHAIGGTHPVLFFDEKAKARYVECTSTHHQMMCIRDVRLKAMLWGCAMLSEHRDIGSVPNQPSNFQKDGPDVEIVYWPGTSTLCFQPHPEYGVKSCEDLFFECLDRAANYHHIDIADEEADEPLFGDEDEDGEGDGD